MAEMTRAEADAYWAKYFHDRAKLLEAENLHLWSTLTDVLDDLEHRDEVSALDRLRTALALRKV